MPFRFPWQKRKPLPVPSFFFIAHAKGGSTWVDGILRSLFGDAVAPRFGGNLKAFQFEEAKIYSACFMTRQQFQGYPEIQHCPRFVLIRDLRDTLVSRYFSMRDTHTTRGFDALVKLREELRSMPIEQGMEHLFEN